MYLIKTNNDMIYDTNMCVLVNQKTCDIPWFFGWSSSSHTISMGIVLHFTPNNPSRIFLHFSLYRRITSKMCKQYKEIPLLSTQTYCKAWLEFQLPDNFQQSKTYWYWRNKRWCWKPTTRNLGRKIPIIQKKLLRKFQDWIFWRTSGYNQLKTSQFKTNDLFRCARIRARKHKCTI